MKRIPKKKTTSSRFKQLRGPREECWFCQEERAIDYKLPDTLKSFTTEGGRILPRRVTGLCSKHQRILTNAIKRARIMALMPFSLRG